MSAGLFSSILRSIAQAQKGMDGWQLVELDGRTTGYIRPETSEAVATLEDLPEHVQEFLSRESQEGRR